MVKGIDYFNREHWLSKIQEKVSFDARKRMYDAWLDFGGPGLPINLYLMLGQRQMLKELIVIVS